MRVLRTRAAPPEEVDFPCVEQIALLRRHLRHHAPETVALVTVAQSQEALPYLEEAVRRAPEQLDGHEWLFLAYTGSKQFARARKEFEVLRRMNSTKIEEWAMLVREDDDPPTAPRFEQN